jgi:thiol-disulfide isomerase/thioredoxin
MAVVLAACAVALTFAEEDKKTEPSAVDAAWQEVQQALRPPPPPADWKTNAPSKQAIAAYEKQNAALAAQASEKARDFYTKYPSHAKAVDARRMELQLLQVAIQLGETNRQAQFDALQAKRLSDPTFPAEEKFNLRAQRIVRLLTDENATQRAANLTKAEQAVRDLREEFPKREEVYELLGMVSQGYLEMDEVAKARAITEDIVKQGKGEAQEQAEVQLRKLNLLGKPLDLKFKDLAGREVNLTNYAGKVVLVDFWATWCGPCVAALPEVKELYAKHHGQGFEILGISLDKDKEALQKFITSENMPWPQYFDGLGWENKLAKKFEISSIPAVWLVDKKGTLRDLNGRDALAGKLEKLLAEK